MNLRNRRRKHARLRTGAYIVEFAISVPVLFLFTLAGFEFTRFEFMRHALNQAAYQGARAGISINGTIDDVNAALDKSLAGSGLYGIERTISPEVIDKDTREVRVVLRANFDDYWIPAEYFGGYEFVGQCTLDHENASLIVER